MKTITIILFAICMVKEGLLFATPNIAWNYLNTPERYDSNIAKAQTSKTIAWDADIKGWIESNNGSENIKKARDAEITDIGEAVLRTEFMESRRNFYYGNGRIYDGIALNGNNMQYVSGVKLPDELLFEPIVAYLRYRLDRYTSYKPEMNKVELIVRYGSLDADEIEKEEIPGSGGEQMVLLYRVLYMFDNLGRITADYRNVIEFPYYWEEGE